MKSSLYLRHSLLSIVQAVWLSFQFIENVGFFAATFCRFALTSAVRTPPFGRQCCFGSRCLRHSRHGRLDASIILLIRLSENVGFFATTFCRFALTSAVRTPPFQELSALSERALLSFGRQCCFGSRCLRHSRHGRLDASIILLIWLSEKVGWWCFLSPAG